MTNPMLAELDEVVRLAEKATLGKWACFPGGKRATVYSAGGHVAFCSQRSFGARGERPVTNDEMISNAQLIAGLVNFLRTHHATLADMAKRLEAAERDAARYRWLRVANFDEAMRALFAEETRTVRNAEKMLDAAIDAATQEGEG